MKYLKQFLIILSVSFLGELLGYLIPLPIPGSIYGIIIMLTGLLTGIIPHSKVKETAHFLIEIMPVMFIPAAAGLLDTWGIISGSLLKYIVIVFSTTVVVMAISGRVTQFFIRRKKHE